MKISSSGVREASTATSQALSGVCFSSIHAMLSSFSKAMSRSLATRTSFYGGRGHGFSLMASYCGHQYFSWRTLRRNSSLTADDDSLGK